MPGVAPSGGGPPELPWPVRLEDATVATLSVTIAERTLLFDTTHFAGTYGGGRLDLEQVTTTWGDAAFAADASFELRDGIDFDVAGDWSAPLAGVASNGTVTLTGTWPELRIHHELATPFAATSDGTLSFEGPFNVDLVSEWQSLAWPGVDEVTSDSGRLTLIGTLDEYRYDGAGVLRILDRDASFTAEGTGDRLELAVARLDLATPTPQGGGSLRGTGTVSLANRTADLAVTANGFDPAWLTAAWSGRLDGTTALRAALLPQPNAALDAIDLRGTLRGYPVTLRGAAAFPEPGSVRLDALRLESEANYVVLTGALDRASLELTVDAELEQLDLLVPDVGGALTADLTLGGTWQQPHGRGRIALRNLSFAGATLGSLDANGELGLAPGARVALTVEGADGARGPVRVADMRVAIDGTTAAHTLRIDAADADWSSTITATGGFTDGVWRGVADRVDIEEEVLGPWRLESPTAVALGRGFATLANSCLLHVSNARWCTELDLRGKPEDRLVVSGQNFDLASLGPLLPPTRAVERHLPVLGLAGRSHGRAARRARVDGGNDASTHPVRRRASVRHRARASSGQHDADGGPRRSRGDGAQQRRRQRRVARGDRRCPCARLDDPGRSACRVAGSRLPRLAISGARAGVRRSVRRPRHRRHCERADRRRPRGVVERPHQRAGVGARRRHDRSHGRRATTDACCRSTPRAMQATAC